MQDPKAEGHQVVTANDGYGAVQAARTERPDLIMLDITMPAGHGFSAHDRLQKLSTTSGVPVIFMSADSSAGPRALAAGAAGFLPKPLTKEAVVSATGRCTPVSRHSSRLDRSGVCRGLVR